MLAKVGINLNMDEEELYGTSLIGRRLNCCAAAAR